MMMMIQVADACVPTSHVSISSATQDTYNKSIH